MAKWIFKVSSWLPVATADAIDLPDSGFMALLGATATQMLQVSEIYVGGVATTSSPTYMQFSRDVVVLATPTALTTGQSVAAMDPATAALAAPPVAAVASTTQPQRSATLGLMNFNFNAFGGIVRWQAYDEKDMPKTLGLATPLGEVSLSAFTGGTPGTVGSHIIFEPK